MRRRARWAGRVAAILAVAIAAGGCGVPSDSDVVVQGPGRARGQTVGDEDVYEPRGREATTDPQEFVSNFLAAAAGSPEKAADRVRQFLPPETQRDWRPAPGVNIVRLEDVPRATPLGREGGWRVQLRVTHVGNLGENGIVEPRPARTASYQFTISEVQKQTGLFVTTNAPPLVMLSDTALRSYYEPRALYFWSRDRATLVPDLRYLSRRDTPISQRPTQIIQWLLDGPSAWLAPAVERLPREAALVGNVPEPTDGRLAVSLLKAADPTKKDQVDRLATQLRWSLRDVRRGTDPVLELRIDQVRGEYSKDDYLAANAAYRGSRKPLKLCVYQRQVRQILPLPEGAAAAPELPTNLNADVAAAALYRALDTGTAYAALLRWAGTGHVLDVAAGAGPVLEPVRHIELNGQKASQLIWLPGSDGTGLVVVAGMLKRFSATGLRLEDVRGAPPGITAVAVPPDGRRLAYITGNRRLFVAPLAYEEASISVGKAQEVPTALAELGGVAWSQESWLVVAGRLADRRGALFDLTVDGALRVNRTDDELGEAKVTHLVALTDDPGDAAGEGEVMYVANGVAYDLFSESEKITSEKVVGPGASPGTGDSTPTAPFFLD
ncbi:MAG TPA: hypothetical protein VFR67_16255 [Pilimelia sp.]|nr:hypothetical protein [Pilimelia sp.]